MWGIGEGLSTCKNRMMLGCVNAASYLGLDPGTAPSRMRAPQCDDLRSSTGLAARRLFVWVETRVARGPMLKA